MSGSIVTMHRTPIAACVARQPSVAMKYCTSGGQRASEIVAAGGDSDRDAAPARKPVRDIAHERPERRRAAESNQPLRERKLGDVAGEGGQHVAGAKRQRAAGDGPHDAAAVSEAAHQHAAEAEADHGERERQRRVAACHAKARLHRRQRHHERPHADTADRAERERRRQPQPCVRGFDLGARVCARGVHVHLGFIPGKVW
jgi:hypothetical protein